MCPVKDSKIWQAFLQEKQTKMYHLGAILQPQSCTWICAGRTLLHTDSLFEFSGSQHSSYCSIRAYLWTKNVTFHSFSLQISETETDANTGNLHSHLPVSFKEVNVLGMKN